MNTLGTLPKGLFLGTLTTALRFRGSATDYAVENIRECPKLGRLVVLLDAATILTTEAWELRNIFPDWRNGIVLAPKHTPQLETYWQSATLAMGDLPILSLADAVYDNSPDSVMTVSLLFRF